MMISLFLAFFSVPMLLNIVIASDSYLACGQSWLFPPSNSWEAQVDACFSLGEAFLDLD